jgi:hypothetical protein
MVLDDALHKIARVYQLTPSQLHPTRLKPKLSRLVQQVYERLSMEDAKLLSKNALKMIFDSTEYSMRGQGNKTAHEAPIEDHADAVLGAGLTAARKALLKKIYYFVHGTEPDAVAQTRPYLVATES